MKPDKIKRCSCQVGDIFADLPPELRPRPQERSSLREVTCPSCGLVYWSNRSTDFCVQCEEKERARHGSYA